MKIKVEHEVPFDKGYELRCAYNDGDFYGNTVCGYHKYRDRTHGRKAPIERKKPICTLFGKWLDGAYNRCDECLAKCLENGGAK